MAVEVAGRLGHLPGSVAVITLELRSTIFVYVCLTCTLKLRTKHLLVQASGKGLHPLCHGFPRHNLQVGTIRIFASQ